MELEDGVEYVFQHNYPSSAPSLDDLVKQAIVPIPSHQPDISLELSRDGCNRAVIRAQTLTERTRPITQEEARCFTDLLRRIFTYDPEKRLSASEVLHHPWLT